jgi:hypothetical protein
MSEDLLPLPSPAYCEAPCWQPIVTTNCLFYGPSSSLCPLCLLVSSSNIPTCLLYLLQLLNLYNMYSIDCYYNYVSHVICIIIVYHMLIIYTLEVVTLVKVGAKVLEMAWRKNLKSTSGASPLSLVSHIVVAPIRTPDFFLLTTSSIK